MAVSRETVQNESPVPGFGNMNPFRKKGEHTEVILS
jgi:hypothetical protein